MLLFLSGLADTNITFHIYQLIYPMLNKIVHQIIIILHCLTFFH